MPILNVGTFFSNVNKSNATKTLFCNQKCVYPGKLQAWNKMVCKAIGSSSWAQLTPAKPSQAKPSSKSLEFYREQGTSDSTLKKSVFV